MWTGIARTVHMDLNVLSILSFYFVIRINEDWTWSICLRNDLFILIFRRNEKSARAIIELFCQSVIELERRHMKNVNWIESIMSFKFGKQWKD